MRSTAPTLADLQVLWGGRDRLLRVGEVAELLAVGAWAVYQMCENRELPHVRINDSIRVRPKDLQEFIASRVTIYVGRASFVGTPAGEMGRIGEGLFALIARNARPLTDHFGIPTQQVVELGLRVDL